MSKYKTINQMFDQFAAHSLPPGAHPQIKEMVKLTYFKAVRDVLAYQHNVLGDPNTPEDDGASTLQGWMDETTEYLGSHPHAKETPNPYK